MKKSIRKILVTSVIFFQTMTTQFVMAEPLQTRITTKEVTFCNEINKTMELFIIPKGGKVNLVKIINEELVRVKWDNKEGNISRKYLKYPVKYTNTSLNLRQMPKNGNIICTMPLGSKVSIIESENGWVKVEFEGKIGYCSEDYLINEHIIGTYSTKLSTNANNVNNIQVASNFINGKIIKKGQVFSYLEAIGGESTTKLGYKEATVIIDGKKTTGIGGGVCQVSSTLYAAIKSIPNSLNVIQIKERYPHTKPVGYIPRELEATVWYPSKDLKFIPNYDIQIRSYLKNGKVYVDIIKL